MRAFSPATPPARRPTSVGAFSPSSISGLRSRLLDANTFTSPIASKYYLKDSSTTNTHLPRQGRCWLFDGTNDFAVGPQMTSSQFTVCVWVKPVSQATGTQRVILSEYGTNFRFIIFRDATTPSIVAVQVYTVGTTNFRYISGSGVLNNDVWTHLSVTVSSSGSVALYVNGVAVPLTLSSGVPGPITSVSESLRVGSLNGSLWYLNASMRDIRGYNVVKTAGEVSAIYNQSRTGSGTFDTTGLLAAYPCNEESGTTGYDISGNGNHLTLTNITQATFHATDTGVLANRNNAEGYRLSGSAYIPKRLTDSLAADGNALTVTGRAAYHGCAETPCLTGNGSNVYVNLGSVVGVATDFTFWFYLENSIGTQVMVYQDGPSSTLFAIRLSGSQINILARSSAASLVNASTSVVISNYVGAWVKCRVQLTLGASGSVALWLNDSSVSLIGATGNLSGTYSPTTTRLMAENMSNYMNGRIANVQITDGVTTYFPLQDGPGSSNTNRDIAWVKSDGTGGVVSSAIVNGTVSTIWGNRVPGNVEDWCVKYGGRIAVNGTFIAGMLTGGNAADGSAKTLAAGKFGNPFSRLNLNPATAAELNGKNIQTAYEDLPCVTGNGSNVYADIGSVTSALGDFDEIEFWLYANGAGPAVGTSGLKTLCWNGELGAFGSDETITTYDSGNATYIKDVLDSGWNHIKFVWNTSKYDIYLNGTSRTTYQSSVGSHCPKWSSESIRLFVWNGGTSYSSSRVSGLRITSGGVTTYFPLSDGSGADLAWFKSDDTKGVVSSALQGTLTNVWANKTDGSKVAATKYALRAIVTRETEFNRVASDGDDRFLIYDNALSGADLTNVEGYLV